MNRISVNFTVIIFVYLTKIEDIFEWDRFINNYYKLNFIKYLQDSLALPGFESHKT